METAVGNRVLVIGASGMVGRAVYSALRAAGWPVECTTRRNPRSALFLDTAGSLEPLGRILDNLRPDWVINCAGVLRAQLVSGQVTEGEAFRTNSIFPRALAAAARARGISVLHVSTEGVFSSRSEPYRESDRAEPPDLYGWSKHLGEALADGFWSVRCSFIGADPDRGQGLLEWFRRQPANQAVPGFTGARWQGVTTRQFARWALGTIGHAGQRSLPPAPVIHLCPNPPLSRYQLLTLWRDVLETGPPIEPVAPPAGTSDIVLASQWPEHSEWVGGVAWRDLLVDTLKGGATPPEIEES